MLISLTFLATIHSLDHGINDFVSGFWRFRKVLAVSNLPSYISPMQTFLLSNILKANCKHHASLEDENLFLMEQRNFLLI
jgi:hypothetical protein